MILSGGFDNEENKTFDLPQFKMKLHCTLNAILLPFYQGKDAKSGEGSATTICLAHKCQPLTTTFKSKVERVVLTKDHLSGCM